MYISEKKCEELCFNNFALDYIRYIMQKKSFLSKKKQHVVEKKRYISKCMFLKKHVRNYV